MIETYILGNKPLERYGQSQTVLDKDNLIIIGGSGGPSFYYSDVWVLNMTGNLWKWKQIEVRNSVDAPVNLWCNPVCKVYLWLFYSFSIVTNLLIIG